MITKKKIIIPIFEIKFTIIIFDDWDEVSNLTENPSIKLRGFASSSLKDWSILVAINSKCGSTIVHEAEHVKNFIWSFICHTPSVENDEVDAYLMRYLYDKIVDVFYKHNKNK